LDAVGEDELPNRFPLDAADAEPFEESAEKEEAAELLPERIMTRYNTTAMNNPGKPMRTTKMPAPRYC
jgi:hypothetical protein